MPKRKKAANARAKNMKKVRKERQIGKQHPHQKNKH